MADGQILSTTQTEAMKRWGVLLALSFLLMGMTCRKLPHPKVYSTDQLEIIQLRKGLYLHVSQIALGNGSTFPCNGLIYTDRGEAVIFDSPAHTSDNIVSYLSAEKVLFGGCQVKAMGAGRGNVADANTALWPAQARAIKEAYPKAELIVPGHGGIGGYGLLDFTAELFSEK
jgi:glyoxylase-like metal-dependent hydrolase (beta-lactamase superfamily II)